MRKGSVNGNSKLTEEDVKKIKEELERGIPISQLAYLYKVSRKCIYKIRNKESWTHVS